MLTIGSLFSGIGGLEWAGLGTVLDPFAGAGTTGLVADRLERNAILVELNREYCEMARKRIRRDSPLFADVQIEGPNTAA